MAIDPERFSLRILDVAEPGATKLKSEGLDLVVTIKPASGTALTLWFIDTGEGDAKLGATALVGRRFLTVGQQLDAGMTIDRSKDPREVVSVPRAIAGETTALLRALGLTDIISQPVKGTDGMTMTTFAFSNRTGLKRFTCWEPSGRAAACLNLFVAFARSQLKSDWALKVLNDARAQVNPAPLFRAALQQAVKIPRDTPDERAEEALQPVHRQLGAAFEAIRAGFAVKKPMPLEELQEAGAEFTAAASKAGWGALLSGLPPWGLLDSVDLKPLKMEYEKMYPTVAE